MDIATMPAELQVNIGSERTDFIVRAGRSKTRQQAGAFIGFGLFVLLFVIVPAIFIGIPLLRGEEISFENDGRPVTASLDNLSPLTVPFIVTGFMSLAGSILVWAGISGLNRPGGYFAATPTRLIHYRNGTIRSIDWEQFSGDITVGGSPQAGDIALGLRTGKMARRDRRRDEYVPDTVYLAGVPDPFGIETICRKRIKENDPTPSHNANIT